MLTLSQTTPPAALHCRPTHLTTLAWLALQGAALWPHGRWMLQRWLDGSDDPLGLAALAALGLVLWRVAPRLRASPHLGWLAAAALLTAAATAAWFVLPPLAAALLAALALGAGLMAWLPAASPRLGAAGLLVLALPLLSSMQFYAGYPLRVATAQLSAWALGASGIEAQRSGASMLVRGHLVIVDAPCSGVQLVWMAYFCACAVAALGSVRDGLLLRRLPFIGGIVLVGNVLRNSVLVALESRPAGLSGALHEAIGLAALALVCGAVVLLVTRGAR
jgi:exosortase/archaeosortase family protein